MFPSMFSVIRPLDDRPSCVSIALIPPLWAVCQHDKTKTAETKIAKLGTGIIHHATSPIN